MKSSSASSVWERLKHKVLLTHKIRDIDRRAVEQFSMNSLVLMENAGSNCVRWLNQRFPHRPRTVVLCGSGNNGGDGLVITRHLRAYGWCCECFVLGSMEKLSADAHANARILSRSGSGMRFLNTSNFAEAIEPIVGAELIIDAMLGTGAMGDPRPPMASWIEAANMAQAHRIAIDIPTGVNADTGEIGSPYFHADATLTFVAYKPAMIGPLAAKTFGEIEVLPIGIPEQLMVAVLESEER